LVASNGHVTDRILAAVLLGIGFTIATPAGMALITTLTTRERRGAVIGAMGTAQGVGALIGPYIGGKLYGSVSHRSPFVGSAILLSLSFLIAIFTVHSAMGERNLGRTTGS